MDHHPQLGPKLKRTRRGGSNGGHPVQPFPSLYCQYAQLTFEKELRHRRKRARPRLPSFSGLAQMLVRRPRPSQAGVRWHRLLGASRTRFAWWRRLGSESVCLIVEMASLRQRFRFGRLLNCWLLPDRGGSADLTYREPHGLVRRPPTGSVRSRIAAGAIDSAAELHRYVGVRVSRRLDVGTDAAKVTTTWLTRRFDASLTAIGGQCRPSHGSVDIRLGPVSAGVARRGAKVSTVDVGAARARLYREGSSTKPAGWVYAWTTDRHSVEGATGTTRTGGHLLDRAELLAVAE